MSTPPPNYTAFTRGEVIGYLGPAWPVPDSATTLTLPPDAPLDGDQQFTGAVAVWPVPGRPGTTWWAVDGSIPPQNNHVPDDALVALLPGSVLVVPPPPDGGPTPPQT